MAAGDPQDHTAKFTQELVPGLGADTPGGQGDREDVVQAVVAVWGQLNGALQGVNEPPQHNLVGCPACIALVQFFQGDWFAPDGRVVGLIIGAEDTVVEVKELVTECVEGPGIALGRQNFVVDKYISIVEGAAATVGPVSGGHGDRSVQGKLSRRGRWSGEREGGVRPGVDRIPSTTPGAEPPRDARDSGSARSHSTDLETSSSNRP